MSGASPWCNLTLVLATTVASCLAFRHRELFEKYHFDPEAVLSRREYWRLLTSAFLHVDWMHLLFNLISLLSFGDLIELALGRTQFLTIYFGAVLGGSLLSLYIHRHHAYRACGASGGVCGIVFASVVLFPQGHVSPMLLPLPIPSWLFAILFVAFSFYGLRTNRDNIGHDAHLGGAIIGLLLTALLNPGLVRAHWPILLLVLIPALLALAWLWVNPLGLPLAAFIQWRPRWRQPRAPSRALDVDAILDKVAAQGLHSLTPDERAAIEELSARYRRREQSTKPKSTLPI